MPIIKVLRSYLPDDSCVLGKLILPDGWSCFTLERPWEQNQQNISCIPEGIYQLGMRSSSIVQRTSGGEFNKGYEIQNVLNRTFIMIHPGNYIRNSKGCILPGKNISYSNKEGLMVTHSRDTFRNLMKRLSEHDDWQIDISTKQGGNE